MFFSQSKDPQNRAKSLAALEAQDETLVDWVRALKQEGMSQLEIIALGVGRGFLDEEMDAALITLRVEAFRRSI
jgi:hypothetical protein